MSAFESLVRPALVRIAAPGDGYDPHGDRYWGTGFFIAPGWVLTCAHVVAKGEARCGEASGPSASSGTAA